MTGADITLSGVCLQQTIVRVNARLLKMSKPGSLNLVHVMIVRAWDCCWVPQRSKVKVTHGSTVSECLTIPIMLQTALC